MRSKTEDAPYGRTGPAQPSRGDRIDDTAGLRAPPAGDEEATPHASFDRYSDARSRWRGFL